MNSIKRAIPNLFTCGNLFCGCLAIVKSFEGNLVWAAYLVGIAAVLDFFDGFMARLLKVSSPIGKDLDSLADMVTFGVVPGVVMFHLLNSSLQVSSDSAIPGWNTLIIPHDMYSNLKIAQTQPLAYLAFIIPIFSALRLAKFNNDTRQTDSFVGVPTPANSILICSLPLIFSFQLNFPWREIIFVFVIGNKISLIVLTLIMSFLLVAELPLFALKFKHFKWKGNEIRYVFLLLCALLLAILQVVGIPLIIVLYVLMSLINNWFFKAKINS
jgi:CDP-diacylglycerol---serine O-phosphatidyltransferase